MAVPSIPSNIAPGEPEIAEVSAALSPPHRQMVLEIARALTLLNRPQNEGALALLEAWQHEAAQARPEEQAQAEAELESFKQALNANRAPAPPLFLSPVGA